jgi:hypothetical protein
MRHDAWVAEVAAARAKFEAENEAMYQVASKYTDAVHPAVIAKVLSDFVYRGNIPKDQTLIGSGGFGIARCTRRWLRAYRPAQIMNGQYQFGTVGADVGYAVGDYEYGTRKLVNLAHETFLFLSEYWADYMWENFELNME